MSEEVIGEGEKSLKGEWSEGRIINSARITPARNGICRLNQLEGATHQIIFTIMILFWLER